MTAAVLGGFQNFARTYGVRKDVQCVRSRLAALEYALEGLIRLPGNQRFGLDAVVGFVPIAGDVISALIGTYLVWEARNAGMSRWKCARMLTHIGFDAAIGAIPMVGDVFDFFYRSNSKNLKMVLAHIDSHQSGAAIS